MAGIDEAFLSAVRSVHTLPERPDNDTLLRLYALYKQAIEGDAEGPAPGFFDVVGHAKHSAWLALRGMPRAEAMRAYVDLVRMLADDMGAGGRS